jgi:ferric-dicitrate binding protein FerR (iron transport regulator)
MNAERPDPMTPEEARAREALRSLTPPRAIPAFRERLKRDFVTGRIGERRKLELPVVWHRRLAWRFALAPAALALLAATVWMADRGTGWTVMGTQGGGAAMVDGVLVPLASREELGRRLRPGARLSVPAGAEVELASTAGLIVQVTAGTEFTLPATPGRWLRRRVTGAVRMGEIRVTTGPAFAGARLRLDTPEAEVEVTGTTLAVICEPAGTCVCVYEGVVKVGARGVGMEAVANGRRRFVFNDGRPPESAGIRPMENTKLGMFRDSRRGWLERTAP